MSCQVLLFDVDGYGTVRVIKGDVCATTYIFFCIILSVYFLVGREYNVQVLKNLFLLLKRKQTPLNVLYIFSLLLCGV